jgi:uncharacterized repeat protein (TIGR01451 family)
VKRLSKGRVRFVLPTCLAALSTLLAARARAQETVGVPWTGPEGVTETVDQIMERQRRAPVDRSRVREASPEMDLRKLLPPRQSVPAPAVSQWPPLARAIPARPYNPQAIGTSFLGIQLSDTAFAIPPDSMGDVGPTQILAITNGRIRVFDKSGVLGGLDTDTDSFFASVGGLDFATADPHVRYDRLSGRWFVTMIDLGVFGGFGIPLGPNGIMIAVSSGPTITSGTSFTFFRFVQDFVGPTPNPDTDGFADYDTLGIDRFALYIGVNVFTQDLSAFIGTTAFVIRKADLIAGTLTVTPFRQLAGNTCPAGAGPFAPQGVNNDDPSATEGYFIGADLCLASTLTLRRISTPGGTPTISGNLTVTVPTTSPPIAQVQPSPSRTLDGLDERLLAAMIHANKITGARTLWTAHNIQVDESGIAIACGTPGPPPYPLCPNGRNGSRWYELGSLTTAPTLVQAGTLFDSATTNPFGYWVPSVAVSGQGHMALGSSRAGLDPMNGFAGVAAAGRFRSDALGTAQSATLAQSSTTRYNVEMTGPQRWGDFSQVGVDPTDDMTMWTFQEYCNALDSWGVRVIQLRAPPPATPNCSSPVQVTMTTQNVTIAGTSIAGSEFFDPGPDAGGPGYPNRLQATVSGGVTVNSVTFNSPTSVTLNVTATPPNGLRNVTITNPDGQSVVGNNCINVNLGATLLADLSITKTDGQTTDVPGTSITYTIVAANAGSNAASGAMVTDTLPAAVTGATWTCVGAGGGTCTGSGAGSINDSVNLPVGATVTYTLIGTISASATGSLSNTATVTAPGGVTDPNPANNSATDTDTLTPQANLSITKTDGQTTEVPGTSVTYTIVASNAGPSAVTGAVVADTVPGTITGGTWTCVGAGGGSCAASGSGNINQTVNLPVGATVTYTLTGTISASATGSLSNTATVTVPGGVTDPSPANNSATDTDALTPQANLSITKTDGQATEVPGTAVTYTIVASNAGPSAVTGATVADTVPGTITGVTWTCVGSGGGTCAASGSGNINQTVNLPVGAAVTYTLNGTISPSATGSLSNTATVTAPGGVTDPSPANNSATDTDTLLPACGAAIVVVPDGRLTRDVIAAAATRWFGTSVKIGNSYSVEFKNDTGASMPPGALTVFSGDDDCSVSTLSTNDTSGIDPAGTTGAVRVSFTATGTGTFFRMKLVSGAGSPIPYTFSASDTTMYSPAWSTNGSFDTFYSFQNTTGTSLSGTLTLLDTAGGVLASVNVTVPAGQTVATNTAAAGVARNRTGTARFTHRGPPGAFVLEAAIANFSTNPAYVQPVKFQAAREAR